MDRRDFLRATATTMGALALAPFVSACSLDERDRDAERTLGADRLLDHPAAQSPIDTIVVVMLENRSFDHYLGWLSTDPAYMDAGRSAYGHSFRVDARASTCATRTPTARRYERSTSSTRRGRAIRIEAAATRCPRTAGAPAGSNATTDSAAAGTGNDGFALGFYNANRRRPARCARPSLHRGRPLDSRRCWPGRSRIASTCTRRRHSA